MAWVGNNGVFKAHRKHWVNKSTVGGKGRRTREEAGGRKEQEGGRRDEGGGGRKEGRKGGRMEDGRKGGEEGVARRRYKALTIFSAVRF